jgi:hypothetical protein
MLPKYCSPDVRAISLFSIKIPGNNQGAIHCFDSYPKINSAILTRSPELLPSCGAIHHMHGSMFLPVW